MATLPLGLATFKSSAREPVFATAAQAVYLAVWSSTLAVAAPALMDSIAF